MGSRPIGRPKRTWLEVVQRDCQLYGLSKYDAMVRGRWRKMIRMVDEQEGCEWMDVSSILVPPHLCGPGQRAVKRLCVCVCVCHVEHLTGVSKFRGRSYFYPIIH